MTFSFTPSRISEAVVLFFRVLRLLSSPSCEVESVTPEESYEMASPYIVRDAMSDAPRRTEIRWVLTRLNAMHMDCPSTVILRCSERQHTR